MQEKNIIKLSVAIISFNEEENILRMLEPLQGLADEIVLVDSHSTDQTVELAKKAGAKVFIESFAGHIAQKNSALEKCQGKWILALDCDEVLTSELADSIRNVLEHDQGNISGYSINRRTFYQGRLLRYAWQPDRKLRLVRRADNPAWGGYDPHDVLQVSGKTSELTGSLLHYSYKNFMEHMEKTIAHAKKAAESYQRKGRSSGRMALLVKPAFALFRRLFIQRAILDGMPGVMAAISGAVYVYMKYAFLWELNKASVAQNSSVDSGR